MKNLEYHFIRTEADNNITLFLRIDKNILEKEVDIVLTEDNELSITVEENQEQFKTNELPMLLYDHLYNKKTLVIFCDGETNFIAEVILSPLGK